ncbi:MAG: hypothetical protein O2807_13180 [bacterium]|nr:hypothetical protein [bacterium]
MKITPYLAQSVTRSYLRQQRVGERIADARVSEVPAPDTEINISEAAREAAGAENARSKPDLLSGDRTEQIARFSGRFADLLLKSSGADAAEKDVPPLGRFLESLGLALSKDAAGETDIIVRKDTGELLVALTQENREEIRAKIQDAASRVLEGLL